MLIIPDTNFLIYAAKFKLWSELEKVPLALIPEVVCELEVLSKKANGKDKESAAFVLERIKPFKIVPKKGYADDIILQKARFLKEAGEKSFAVATMDKELLQKLRKEGIKTIGIRQKKLLVS
ncbi:MAG: PIN domain-containing protein [Candidatus Paceibacterota bacterium]